MPLAIHRGKGYKQGCARGPGMATLLSAGRGWQKYSLRRLSRVARMHRLRWTVDIRQSSEQSRG